MKTTAAKFTVAQLAKMMGKPAKEVLFLLQGIGVDVKTAESVLDPATAQALLMGKTQAPKSLIVRQAPSAAAAIDPDDVPLGQAVAPAPAPAAPVDPEKEIRLPYIEVLPEEARALILGELAGQSWGVVRNPKGEGSVG
ncbi:MAG TPA: translation initiation factor IF-2 N-terminal domain-containing protein, partial [Thermoanaerobaculia bacterium]|nr:translation initiation factor IF-2 N-terminal domain-containing protein [Thermoanaerobaculia bacterium]